MIRAGISYHVTGTINAAPGAITTVVPDAFSGSTRLLIMRDIHRVVNAWEVSLPPPRSDAVRGAAKSRPSR